MTYDYLRHPLIASDQIYRSQLGSKNKMRDEFDTIGLFWRSTDFYRLFRREKFRKTSYAKIDQSFPTLNCIKTHVGILDHILRTLHSSKRF